jgi:pimeloyl-ACP methyl ester carboxylesterase
LNKKTKISTIFSIIAIGLLLVGTQFVTVVSSKKPSVTYDEEGEYSIIIGKLGGARWALYMPDNWNGMLIIGCRGHMHELPNTILTGMMPLFARYFMDDLTRRLPEEWRDERFAFAWSDYGEGGYCIKSGVIRTHQLTEYLVDNYDVSGKVFLYSLSMGGAVGLTLAEKYPDLYNGVFDWFGTKNLTHTYYHKAALAEQTTLQGIIDYFNGFNPPIPYDAYDDKINEDPDDSNYQNYTIGQEQTRSNVELECGGTPDRKPKAYERRSPVCNPEVSIPIIVVHGTYDRSVPYVQSVAYCEAVNSVTEPDLCELVTMDGKGHGGMWIFPQLARFFDLVEWAEDLGT